VILSNGTNHTADFENLGNLDGVFSQAIWNVTDNVKNFNNTIGVVVELLNDPETGIVPNLNCTIFGSDLRRLYNNFCTGFIVSLYQAALCIVLASIFSFFGVFFIFCLAKRLIIPDAKDDPRNAHFPNWWSKNEYEND